MEYLAKLLQEHFCNHPGMELRDAIKFLYQSSMGGGHLIADPHGALAPSGGGVGTDRRRPSSPTHRALGRRPVPSLPGRLQGVWARSIYRSRPVPPGNGGIFPAAGAAGPEPGASVPPPLPTQGDRGGYPSVPRRRNADGGTQYSLPSSLLPRLPGGPPVGRGPAPPSGRPSHRSRRERPRTLAAIDGPCATGKSTLGARLSQLYGCPLFHMDDFFLLPERKTPERLAQPGGNVDYERFFAQVLAPLSRGEPVLYQPYRCHSGALAAARTIPPAPLAVVEGVYSLRPEFQPLYQVKCFLSAPWPVREARLLERCGPEGLERFRILWIPLEDRYFQAFSISAACDTHLETGKTISRTP